MSKFNIGDKVRYVNTDHDAIPDYYPPYGTIGVFKGNGWVQWPIGVTSRDGCWCCDENDIELVKNVDMTNEEIWEMLRPKLVKNGLDWIHYGYDSEGNKFYYFDEKALMNAVSTAYKSGYYRSQKGRPFKFGEKKAKKQGGHWEPVDPNNLPKEGTKVRYSRPICFEDEFYLIGWNVGDEGIVNYHENYFGVKREGKNWDGVGMFGYYFDMWVEDDE